MRGALARWGTRLVAFPLLDPRQAEEHPEPGPLPPYPPWSLDPPSTRDHPPPPAPPWEGGRGKGGNTTSRVPPTSRDPLPLLTKGFF